VHLNIYLSDPHRVSGVDVQSLSEVLKIVDNKEEQKVGQKVEASLKQLESFLKNAQAVE